MASLSGPQWGPASGGKPGMIVVLVHGLGADGHDLIDLAPHWGKAVPEALFVAPDGPEPCDMGPYGRQWFSLAERTPAMLDAGVRSAAPLLDAFIAETCAAQGLPESAVVLMGFSQGAMTSLFAGLRRAPAPAGIMAYSGALLSPEALAGEIRARPRVLLVHGEADEVVPVQGSRAAEKLLGALEVPVESLYCPKLGHGIDDAGLSAGSLFLQRAAAELAGGARSAS